MVLGTPPELVRAPFHVVSIVGSVRTKHLLFPVGWRWCSRFGSAKTHRTFNLPITGCFYKTTLPLELCEPTLLRVIVGQERCGTKT